MHIPLRISNKGIYPFRLGVTSFVYPDTYLVNAELLAPYFDEIEILMFESTAFPSESEIEGLRLVAEKSGITYDVHLPTDISLTDDEPAVREHAARRIREAISLTSPLSPSTFTLHLSYEENSESEAAVGRWQEKARDGILRLLSHGVESRKISVETLSHPFEWAEKIVEEYDLSVCMDIGHLFKYGYDAKAIFERYASRIVIIHLHGVRDDKDHIALDALTSEHAGTAMEILRKFRGVVSLEIFSYRDLIRSLDYLNDNFERSDP